MRVLIAGAWMFLLCVVAQSCVQEDEDLGRTDPSDEPVPRAGQPEVNPYEYKEATLAAFDELIGRPGWKPTSPSRNPQGMLEAVHEKTGLTFVLIPAGEFMMGSPDDEEGHQADESPVHAARVPAFLMCRTECTQRAWNRIGGEDSREENRWQSEPSLPIHGVHWKEAAAWCGRAGLRLPSEAEWEYACRAGSRTRWSFGDDETAFGEYGVSGVSWKRPRMRAVAGKKPNAWGLYDMHGNAFEWCEDWWHASYEGAPTDGTAWIEGATLVKIEDEFVDGVWVLGRRTVGDAGGAPLRVCRSGDFTVNSLSCRSAQRYSLRPLIDNAPGLRPAADLPE